MVATRLVKTYPSCPVLKLSLFVHPRKCHGKISKVESKNELKSIQ